MVDLIPINTRVQNKRDLSEIWEAENPILLDGELIVVDTSDGLIKIKIGDGVSTYDTLPFYSEKTTSIFVDVVLAGDSWVDSIQKVEIPTLVSYENGIVSINNSATLEEYEAGIFAFLCIVNQVDTTLTVYASGDIPNIDIPITIILFG